MPAVVILGCLQVHQHQLQLCAQAFLVVVLSEAMGAMLQFLSAARLDGYSAALQSEFGAACVEDLAALDESELSAVGMKKIERKRLQRQLARSRGRR
eukprot:COSAG02_NODE_3107_length_7352_cov_61.084930_3_plen_97_part_00